MFVNLILTETLTEEEIEQIANNVEAAIASAAKAKRKPLSKIREKSTRKPTTSGYDLSALERQLGLGQTEIQRRQAMGEDLGQAETRTTTAILGPISSFMQARKAANEHGVDVGDRGARSPELSEHELMEAENKENNENQTLIAEELRRRAMRTQQLEEKEKEVKGKVSPALSPRQVSPASPQDASPQVKEKRQQKRYGRARHHDVDIDSLMHQQHKDDAEELREVRQVAKDLAEAVKEHQESQVIQPQTISNQIHPQDHDQPQIIRPQALDQTPHLQPLSPRTRAREKRSRTTMLGICLKADTTSSPEASPVGNFKDQEEPRKRAQTMPEMSSPKPERVKKSKSHAPETEKEKPSSPQSRSILSPKFFGRKKKTSKTGLERMDISPEHSFSGMSSSSESPVVESISPERMCAMAEPEDTELSKFHPLSSPILKSSMKKLAKLRSSFTPQGTPNTQRKATIQKILSNSLNEFAKMPSSSTSLVDSYASTGNIATASRISPNSIAVAANWYKPKLASPSAESPLLSSMSLDNKESPLLSPASSENKAGPRLQAKKLRPARPLSAYLPTTKVPEESELRERANSMGKEIEVTKSPKTARLTTSSIPKPSPSSPLISPRRKLQRQENVRDTDTAKKTESIDVETPSDDVIHSMTEMFNKSIEETISDSDSKPERHVLFQDHVTQNQTIQTPQITELHVDTEDVTDSMAKSEDSGVVTLKAPVQRSPRPRSEILPTDADDLVPRTRSNSGGDGQHLRLHMSTTELASKTLRSHVQRIHDEKKRMLMSTTHTDIELLKQKILHDEQDIHGSHEEGTSAEILVTNSEIITGTGNLKTGKATLENAVTMTASKTVVSSKVTVEESSTKGVKEVDLSTREVKEVSSVVVRKKGVLKRGMSTDRAADLIDALHTKASSVPLARMDSTDSLVLSGHQESKEAEIRINRSASKKATTTFFRYSKASLKHLLRQQSELRVERDL